MRPTELIVIYFACGSPFAVERFTRIDTVNGWGRAVSVVVNFAFWPIFAVRYIADYLFGKIKHSGNSDEIETFRTDIERLAFTNSSSLAVFAFRDIFYRYTGLFDLFRRPGSVRVAAEIFEIDGHPNAMLASVCLARNNRARLQSHLSAARTELIEMLSQATDAMLDRTEALDACRRMFDHLSDAQAVAELTSPSGVSADTRSVNSASNKASRYISQA